MSWRELAWLANRSLAHEYRRGFGTIDLQLAEKFAELFVRPNKIVASIRILTQTVTLIQEPGDLKPFAQPLIVVLDLNVSNINVYRFKVCSIACF